MIRQTNDLLSDKLAREAHSLAPAFSDALHARIMNAVNQAPSAQIFSMHPRISYWRPLAAAAMLGLVITAAWKAQRNSYAPPQFAEITATLRDAATPLKETMVENLPTPTRATDALAGDAERLGRFLVGQFDFLDVPQTKPG